MAIPQQVRNAAAEADQTLHQLAASNTPAPLEPVPAAPAPAEPSPNDPPPAPAPAPSAQPTDPATELQRLHQQLQSESGRRATNEAEMHELRGRVQQLTEQLSRTPQAPAPAPTPPPPLITDQDRTDFGEDMIDFVGRVVRQAYGATIEALVKRVNALEGQLRQVGQQAQTAQQSAEEIATAKYFQTLNELVPGWQATNDDPGFVDWLKNRDTFSRKSRHEMLKSAHAEADAETVAAFFKAYWTEKGVTPAAAPAPTPTPAPAAAPTVDPATLVAPSASNAPTPAANPRGGRIWSQAEIEQVFDDRMKKRITPERFAELEQEIERAMLEGRVQ